MLRLVRYGWAITSHRNPRRYPGADGELLGGNYRRNQKKIQAQGLGFVQRGEPAIVIAPSTDKSRGARGYEHGRTLQADQ